MRKIRAGLCTFKSGRSLAFLVFFSGGPLNLSFSWFRLRRRSCSWILRRSFLISSLCCSSNNANLRLHMRQKHNFTDEITMMLLHQVQKQTLTWSLHLLCCVCVNKHQWRKVCVQSRNAHTPCRPRRKTCDKFSTFVLLLKSSSWWRRKRHRLCESLWRGHSLQHTNTQKY